MFPVTPIKRCCIAAWIEAGTAFLPKPFSPEALVARVSELLAAREESTRAASAAGENP